MSGDERDEDDRPSDAPPISEAPSSVRSTLAPPSGRPSDVPPSERPGDAPASAQKPPPSAARPPPNESLAGAEQPAQGEKSARRARPLLVVERVSKVFPVRRGLFGETQFLHAVEDVSFYLRRSETLGIVGESGSGKSTLARAILRLTEPTFGRILFDDRDITRMSLAELRPMRRRMQIIFQDPSAALNPRMTVRECVGEGLSIFRMAKDEAEARELVAKALSLVGLPERTMGRFPHELSGGQKQRVGIARALAVKPELLVCDEPVSALDASVQAQILNLLLRLQRDLGLSMLFISHDLRVVAHTSHRVAVMFLGRIVEMGPTLAVCDRRYHPYTRALFDAMPKLGPDARARLPIVTDLSADTPSAVDPPKGCVYTTRCPRFEKGKCDVDPPVLSEVVPGSHHRVACWHPEV
jgi:oligopeptide transport system ATP-binding protein